MVIFVYFRDTLQINDSGGDGCTGISHQCPPPTVKVEKVNGGLRVFGVLIGKNCRVSLPAFGVLFLFIGVILTSKILFCCALGCEQILFICATRTIFARPFLFFRFPPLVVAFKDPDTDEDPINAANREETVRNIRILGPVCILVGITMLTFAAILKYLSKRAKDEQTRIGFYCPVHGDFYPLSPGIDPRKYSCE